MQKLKKHSFLLGTLATVMVCATVTWAARSAALLESIPTDCTAIIYTHEDPATVMNGTSPCVPCNNLVADLLRKYKVRDTGERIVGTGPGSIFRIVKAPPQVKFTPLVVYYYNNGTRDYISGYEGNIREVALKHPAFGGVGGARYGESQLKLASAEASGFRSRNGAQLQTLAFRGEEQAIPHNYNETPFLPTEPLLDVPEPQTEQDQLAQCGLIGQLFGVQNCAASSAYGYGAYSQNCAASSAYAAPFSSCNGGGGVGGGGDYYNPSAFYGQPYYQQPVMPAYQQPVYRYAAPSYGYQAHRPYAGRMVCGPNGCYYVN